MSYDYIGIVEDVQSVLKKRLKTVAEEIEDKGDKDFDGNEHAFVRGYLERLKSEKMFLEETLKQVNEWEQETEDYCDEDEE